MTILHGKNTTVLLGSVNLSQWLDSFGVSASADSADATMFQATWRSGYTGQLSGTADVSGLYDPAQASLPTLFLAGLPGVLTGCPGAGAAIGDRARLVSALDVSYKESASVGGLVAIAASFTADGVVGFGDVLHPLGEDTNTTTGAAKNELASSSTGWTAHLHVTLVDGGTWTIKLQDSTAANFSDVADVSGGSFTATAAVTSQRLVGAAGATVRQYVRYVATRAGGSAGDGITFFLALARN